MMRRNPFNPGDEAYYIEYYIYIYKIKVIDVNKETCTIQFENGNRIQVVHYSVLYKTLKEAKKKAKEMMEIQKVFSRWG